MWIHVDRKTCILRDKSCNPSRARQVSSASPSYSPGTPPSLSNKQHEIVATPVLAKDVRSTTLRFPPRPRIRPVIKASLFAAPATPPGRLIRDQAGRTEHSSSPSQSNPRCFSRLMNESLSLLNPNDQARVRLDLVPSVQVRFTSQSTLRAAKSVEHRAN